MPDEEKPEESQLKIPDVLPVLALRDIVVFPFMLPSYEKDCGLTEVGLLSEWRRESEPSNSLFPAGFL